MMNDIFDALNRRHPAEGVRKNDKNLEVFLYVMLNVECLLVPHICINNNSVLCIFVF